MATWVIRCSVDGKPPLWYGDIQAPDRNSAKKEARSFVSRHLPLDTTHILNIAQGSVQLRLDGPVEPFDKD